MKNSAIFIFMYFYFNGFFVLMEYSFLQGIFLFAVEGLYEFISKCNIVEFTLVLVMVQVLWDVTL